MSIAHLPLAVLPLALPLAAQGALPLDGAYVFSEIQGEHGSNCGGPPIFNLLGSQTGTIAFFPDGTTSLTVVEHGACEDGTFFTGSGTDTPPYTVDVDGVVTIDPGPEEFRAVLRPNLAAFVGAGDSFLQGPTLVVGTRLSSGLDDSVLAGPYHFARLGLSNDGGGTRGEVWVGLLTFDGAGGFSASFTSKSVDPVGATSIAPQVLSGSYAVAPDGKLLWNGLDGGVTADGGMFHAAELNGQDVALLVGVPVTGGAGATDALLGGAWALGDLYTGFGPGSDTPEFCSTLAVVDVNAAAATYALTGSEVCATPFGETFSASSDSGTYAVGPDGSLLIFDGGLPPGLPGAVDPSGTLAFVADAVTTADINTSFFLRRGKLPTPFGTATAGTGGVFPKLASSGGFAFLGNPAFAFELSQALGGAPAFLGLTVQPGVGLPLFGGTVWIDPGTLILIQPLAVSAGGAATLAVPVPLQPTLDGATVHAQAIVVDVGGPAGFSMTAGLAIPLMR